MDFVVSMMGSGVRMNRLAEQGRKVAGFVAS